MFIIPPSSARMKRNSCGSVGDVLSVCCLAAVPFVRLEEKAAPSMLGSKKVPTVLLLGDSAGKVEMLACYKGLPVTDIESTQSS